MAELAGGAVEQIQAIEGADPQPAAPVFEDRTRHVVGQAGGIKRVVAKRPDHPRGRVEPVQAAARRNPQRVVAVDQHAAHGVAVRVALGQRLADEAPAGRVEASDAGAPAGPDHAAAVARHRVDQRVAQAVRVARLMAQHAGHAGGRIEQIEAVAGAQPQLAGAVVDDGAHLVVRQRSRAAGQFDDAGEAAAAEVDAAHAGVPGTDPEGADAVAEQRRDAVVGQAVVVGRLVAEVGEAARLRVPAIQPVVLAADPQGGIAVLEQHADFAAHNAIIRAQQAALAGAGRKLPAFESGQAADPQRLTGVNQQRAHGIKLGARARQRVMLEAGGARRQAVQAERGADPQAPAGVQRQRVDLVVNQARWRARDVVPYLEDAGFHVEVLQAIGGGDPQAVLAVAFHRVDMAVAVTALVRLVRRIVYKRLGGRVEPFEAAVGADPEPAGAVDMQHAHPVADDAARVADFISVGRHPVAVEARQAGLAAEPHEAVAVLDHRQDRFLGQPVFDAELLETQAARRLCGLGGEAQAAQQQQQKLKPAAKTETETK